MDQIDIGLRHRVERIVRQIINQHRSLNVLYGDLTAALQMESFARTADIFEYYADAVCAHFSLEETCLFPACRGLNPKIEADLTDLCLEHTFFVGEMRRLKKLLFEENVSDSIGVLSDFYSAIAEHEKKEEQLIRGLLAANPLSVMAAPGSPTLSRI